MLYQCLAVLALAYAANAQYYYYAGICPPENSDVAAFRNLTDVREPLYIPLIDRVMKDAGYALPEIQERLNEVDLPWKVSLPLNDTNGFKLFHPFYHRCCDFPLHECTFSDIILQYVKFAGGVCWVVWPEVLYVYRRCTCCSCLLAEDCPVVGRCVESDYHTVNVIAYCPHIMYSDRYQWIAMRIPTTCRCQAFCPTPLDYVLPLGSPEAEKQEAKLNMIV
ncbi:uncharacterized protein LOC143276687 [Babylonia areolata]|uniref:uncharacterized protein LOC143276687 n=1 Tax=Babylonia areolata TaxID=304850 RepID=UPI003FD1D52C